MMRTSCAASRIITKQGRFDPIFGLRYPSPSGQEVTMRRARRSVPTLASLALVAAISAAVIFASAAPPIRADSPSSSRQSLRARHGPSRARSRPSPSSRPSRASAIRGWPTSRTRRRCVSPTKYLGHVVGAAGELSSTAKIYGYFRKLAETSPRVRVETIGRSEEGRDILLVAVADEAGLRDLDRLKAATAALADPRKTTPEAAEALIASARPSSTSTPPSTRPSWARPRWSWSWPTGWPSPTSR